MDSNERVPADEVFERILHARTLYLCVLDATGAIRLHKRLRCEPDAFVRAIEPYRSDLVVGAECIFCWYWLADLCAREQLDFVLGHALYMKAIHGGKAKIDSHKTAVLLRGGAFPIAFVYPREMRATRDLLRRRLFFVRKRGELFAHVLNTFSQSSSSTRKTAPVSPTRSPIPPSAAPSKPTSRSPSATTSSSVASRAPSKTRPAPRPRSPLESEHRSAGKRTGSGGAKIGNAHLKWAFSEAAVLFLRDNPRGQLHLKRLQHKHGKGKWS